MGTVKSIRVRNLRSFPNEGEFFDLKKINLLVGKNSSGKSSFLRVFPLLRQSFEEATTGPILWFGKYVDFGDFNNSLNNKLSLDKDDTIYFDFKLSVDIEGYEGAFPITYKNGKPVPDVDYEAFEPLVDLTLGVNSLSGTTKACYISIKIENCLIEIFPNYKGRRTELKAINLSTGLMFRDDLNLLVGGSDFIPSLIEKRRIDGKYRFFNKGPGLPYQAFESQVELLSSVLLNSDYGDISSYLSEASLTSKERYINKMLISLNDTFVGNKVHESDVYMYALVSDINSIIDSINFELDAFFRSVRYLGPVRATAERFYRYQDLRVNEIDHMGENLPMVINSLPKNMRKLLEDWTRETFGFSLTLKPTGSHMTIMIQEEGESSAHNISDMGFGYSQLLPIIVSIWMQIYKPTRNKLVYPGSGNKTQIIVIEQPELHLHPEMQYKFAKAIVEIVSLSAMRSDLIFVLETHSKHMIDAFGHAIQDKELSSDHINITLFEKNERKETMIKTSGFDEDGYLKNWPVGFLSA